MSRPPRRPDEPLFGLREGVLALGQGVVLMGAVLVLFVGLLPVLSETQARACAFMALVVGNLTLALAGSASGASLMDRGHRVFWAIATAAVAILALIIVAPGVNTTFDLSPPPPSSFGVAALTGLAAGGWFWIVRALNGWRAPAALRSAP